MFAHKYKRNKFISKKEKEREKHMYIDKGCSHIFLRILALYEI